MAALHRVCLDNALFLPSFPISDMSDLELEKAAMAPRRWIEFCGAFENQHLNDDSGAILHPRTTRIITDSFDTEVDYNNTDFVLVPGGRYLVSSSPDGISVLDLGYTSSADCKPIASVGPESEDCIVQPTPDGMGLTIFSSHRYEGCFVYEIYPQSETPHLIQIAHLDIDLSGTRATYLLTGRVIWCVVYEDRIVFTVWDYRLNHSIKFSVHVDSKQTASLKVMATQTAAIVLLKEAVLIWAFPPLSPQPPDFSDDNLTSIPPLFTIPFPDGIAISSARIGWKTISPWYFAFSHPLYFDISCKDSEIQRFQIMLKPDLSSASLRVINTSELTHDFNYVFFYDYMICEDSLVSCWTYDDQDQHRSGVYTRLPSARFAISHGGPTARMLLPDIGRKHLLYFCPASGRFVVLDDSNSVTVFDIF